MMSFSEMVQKRESCRSFSERPVEKDKILNCIEVARFSPSACNSQPWHFTVANGDIAKEVAKCTQDMGMNKFTDNCPAFIVVTEEEATLSAKLGGMVKKQQYAQIDIGLVTAHICYSAIDMGLSTCIIGWFNEKKICDVLSLTQNKRVRVIIAIGYAATSELRDKSRKAQNEIMTYMG